MKQITFLLVLVALFAASCSNKNGMFTKRKYTKGHYIAHVGKVAKPQEHQAKQIASAEQVRVKTEEVKPVAEPAKHVAVASASSAKANSTHVVKPVQVNKIAKIESSEKPALSQKLANHRAINKITHAKSKKVSDEDLIVWVILSLFPIACLFAIYLHDGKSITTNFWIDLILHITVWGECIFALLVVLDLIDLS